jgi:hypothetical protein
MYRDTVVTEDSTDGGRDAELDPRLAPPTGFALVFRDSSHPAVTLWRPLPPRGYSEVCFGLLYITCVWFIIY